MADQKHTLNRRSILKGAAGVAAGLTLAGTGVSAQEETMQETVVKNGRINQSIAFWCFQPHWDLRETCRVAKQLGCPSVELVEIEDWPVLKEEGLVCGLAYSHWFDEGMNNPRHHAMCIEKMRASIDACAEFGFPNVITFTGYSEGISEDDGIRNCVNGYKNIVGHAEEKGVTLCLEMLNTRVDEEMKGHPGYQGDHTDYVMEIIKQVGSPSLKLLFDVYHVQIMDGDVIRRIQQYKDYIGHYHTAGNPGRHDLDDTQEINYKAVMEAIAETGYTGYVGQEFLPKADPYEALKSAVMVCDV